MPGRVRSDLFDTLAEGTNELHWLQRRIQQLNLAHLIDLDYVDISVGENLPNLDGYDAVVVGGSFHNANEGHDWQLALFDWLRDWRTTERPLLGICGGHQHAAIALGGSVAVLASGVNARTAKLALTETGRSHYLFDHCGEQPSVHFAHFDHVDRAPDTADVLASYQGTIQAMDLGGQWITVQFHPEANTNLMIRGWDNTLEDVESRYQPAPLGPYYH